MLVIANAMVRAYKDLIGRGPSKCRVYFAGADTLVVVLEKSMTVSERTLAALGEDGRVRDHRLLLSSAGEERFRSIVEDVLGRQTRAYISGFDIRRDVAVEVFTLATDPGEEDTPSADRPSGGRVPDGAGDSPAQSV